MFNADKTVRRSYGTLSLRDPLSATSVVTVFIAHMYALVVPGTNQKSGTVRLYHVTGKEKPLPQRSNAAAEMCAKTARLQVLFDNLSHPHISSSLKQLLEAKITKMQEDGVTYVATQVVDDGGAGNARCRGASPRRQKQNKQSKSAAVGGGSPTTVLADNSIANVDKEDPVAKTR